MDISQAAEYIKQLYIQYVLPHVGTFAKIAAAVIVAVILLRILLPVVWENILWGIIEISDKKLKMKRMINR